MNYFYSGTNLGDDDEGHMSDTSVASGGRAQGKR